MDWQQFATTWGPAIPLAIVILRAHTHLIYSVIPQGIATLAEAVKSQEARSEQRHDEIMQAILHFPKSNRKP